MRDSKEKERAEAPHLQASGNYLRQVLDDVGKAKRCEAAQRKPASHRVLVPAVLLKRVDGEERELRVRWCVGADVQVDHLLYYVVLGGDRLSEHRAEQW